MIGNLGLGEILTIVVVLLLLFGARRIPEAARGIGRGLRDFKAAMNGEASGEKPSGEPCCPGCASADAEKKKTGGA